MNYEKDSIFDIMESTMKPHSVVEIIDQKPVIPYNENPRYEQERRINGYIDNSPRKLDTSMMKCNVTGIVTEPVSRHLDEADRQLPPSNKGF